MDSLGRGVFMSKHLKGESVMAATPVATVGKRMNFILSERAHSELVALARETRRSMTDLVRLGLGLVKIALEAERNGKRLVVTTSDGRPEKEIVLPS
jgi:hypothetical protein